MLVLKANAAPAYLNIPKNIIKSNLLGNWEMVTQVVWSECPYVSKGEISKSELKTRKIGGKMYPIWDTNDWKLVSDNEINFIDNRELRWERESTKIDGSSLWYVESLNKFELDGAEKMHGESLVKQYLDGEYVGQYMTVSYLKKV